MSHRGFPTRPSIHTEFTAKCRGLDALGGAIAIVADRLGGRRASEQVRFDSIPRMTVGESEKPLCSRLGWCRNKKLSLPPFPCY